MNYKSGTLFFIISSILIITVLTIYIKFFNRVVINKKKKYIKQKKIYSKNKPYFDRNILVSNRHSWHNKYNSRYIMINLRNFRPHHPHHYL